jgi:hypothetical protein
MKEIKLPKFTVTQEMIEAATVNNQRIDPWWCPVARAIRTGLLEAGIVAYNVSVGSKDVTLQIGGSKRTFWLPEYVRKAIDSFDNAREDSLMNPGLEFELTERCPTCFGDKHGECV